MKNKASVVFIIKLSLSAFSAYADSDIPLRIETKLESCLSAAPGAVYMDDCYETSIKDYSRYQSDLESAINYNLDIKNKNKLISELKSDFTCSDTISESIMLNEGSMWPRQAMRFCSSTKGLALKKWLDYYQLMKETSHYHKVANTYLD